MSLITLPCICESNLQTYISNSLSGSDYPVLKSFDVVDYELPAIVVMAGGFSEVEPGMNVFKGTIAVAVLTQIDTVSNPLSAHDSIVGDVYSLLQTEPLLAAFNSQENGNLFGCEITSFQQSREDRSLVSTLQLEVHVQALGLN